ncbi:MAG: hypothetical protein ACK5Y6_02710 [Pseudomonadota bacterium]|jgi:hypothetical protein
MSTVNPNQFKNVATMENATNKVAENMSNAEKNLMTAYALDGSNMQLVEDLARKLGVKTEIDSTGKITNSNLKSLQLIAEQRYQQASHVMNMFTSIIDKMDQAKSRIIQKFGQG